jgi:hypothetical protein
VEVVRAVVKVELVLFSVKGEFTLRYTIRHSPDCRS